MMGFGPGMLILWLFMTVIFGGIGLVIFYFIIKFAVRNAIRDSELDIRLAVRRGIMEAHKELDNINKSIE